MALHDWNGDGKKDWQDDFFEYQIYKETTGQNDKQSYTPGNGSSNVKSGTYLVWYIIALIIGYGINEFLGVIIMVGVIFWMCAN